MLHRFTAALVAYGPWGIFLLSAIDSVGAPLPAAMDVLLIGVAAASVKTPFNAWFAAAMAVLGSIGGNVVLFMAARQGRRWLARKEPALGKKRRFQEWFQRYGMLSVFVPTATPVLPLPLKPFVISAGALRTPMSKFLIVILFGRILRYGAEAYLGLQLGEEGARTFFVDNAWTLGGVALGFVVALYLFIRFRDGRAPA